MSLLLQSMLAAPSLSSGFAGKFTVSDALELGDAESNFALASSGLTEGIAKIEELLVRSEMTALIDPSNKDLVKRDVIETRNALSVMGMSDRDTVTATCGFESARSSKALGNEAWTTMRKVVSDAIDWLVRQLEDAQKWIMKVFNKYFGAFESQKKDWEKLLVKANEAATEGLVIETKEKWEATRAVNYYTSGGTVGDANKFGLAAVSLGKEFKDDKMATEFSVPSPDELLVGEEIKPVADLLKYFPGILSTDNKTAELPDRPGYTARRATTMYGEVTEFCNRPDYEKSTTATEMTERLKAMKRSLLPINPKAKIKDSLKMDYATSGEVVALGEKYMELLDMTITLVRGNPMQKMSKSLDEAIKDLKKWAKDTPSEDAGSKLKTNYRLALNLTTSYVNATKRLSLETVNAYSKYVLSCSTAHYAWAAASIKEHKKSA
jgi:hypothetical protein